MDERTIGQVLQAAREDLSLSLGEVQDDLKIQKRYLLALENDDFDDIPGPSQARQLLAKYADYLDLEVWVILDAYDKDNALLVYEMDLKERSRQKNQRRRRPKRKPTYLPLVYLLVLALTIVAFVFYTVWQYYQNRPNSDPSASSAYSVDVRDSSASGSTTSISSTSSTSSSSTESSSQAQTSLTLVSAQANNLVIDVVSPTNLVDVTLSVEATTSWISLSGTDLASGRTLSPEDPSVTLQIDKTILTSSLLTLGVVEGVTVKIGDQTLDLSSLTEPSATVTLNFK